MTDLEKLAIKRIDTLVKSLEFDMSVYLMARTDWSEDQCREKDKKSSDNWSKNTQAIREIEDWVEAINKNHKK